MLKHSQHQRKRLYFHLKVNVLSKKSGYQSNTLKHICAFPQCQIYGIEPSQINQTDQAPMRVNIQHTGRGSPESYEAEQRDENPQASPKQAPLIGGTESCMWVPSQWLQGVRRLES